MRTLEEIEKILKNHKPELKSKLPSVDSAITQMHEHGIEYDINPLLNIGKNVETPTSVLEMTIQDYSERELIFCGLTGQYKEALEALNGPNKPGVFKRFFSKTGYEQIAQEYVDKLEPVLPGILSDFQDQYQSLQNNGETNIDQILSELKLTLTKKMNPLTKFLRYHDGIYNLTKEASQLADGSSNELVRGMNRAIQEHMDGIYGLR